MLNTLIHVLYVQLQYCTHHSVFFKYNEENEIFSYFSWHDFQDWIKSVEKEKKVYMQFYCKTKISTLVSNYTTIINSFVGHKNWVDTDDVRIQLYWECTNSTLPLEYFCYFWCQDWEKICLFQPTSYISSIIWNIFRLTLNFFYKF